MKTLDELGISPAPWQEICGCVLAGRREGEIGREQIFESDNVADARLVAAAPMLYEALRGLFNFMPLVALKDSDIGKAMVAAKAALAVASGESDEGEKK